MGIRTKIFKDGNWVEGEELDFEIIKEDWNIYKAEDGTIIKIKVVAAKIIRTEDKNRLTGDPGYTVTSQNVVSAIVSDEAKKK
jgi:hypothetical protein